MNNETNLKSDEKIFRDRKPRTCPSCNGKNVAVILWGLPMITAELTKAVDENKIVFGGCCISENDPVWRCADCYAEIWRQKIENY
jgi:hypothetical protein